MPRYQRRLLTCVRSATTYARSRNGLSCQRRATQQRSMFVRAMTGRSEWITSSRIFISPFGSDPPKRYGKGAAERINPARLSSRVCSGHGGPVLPRKWSAIARGFGIASPQALLRAGSFGRFEKRNRFFEGSEASERVTYASLRVVRVDSPKLQRPVNDR